MKPTRESGVGFSFRRMPAGRRDLVLPLAIAATAVGSDGLIVEAHPRPDEALSDKEQALGPDDLRELISRVRSIAVQT